MEKLTLTKDEIEQIKTVNESASKAAAEALSKMISKETKVTYPTLSLKPIDEISKLDNSHLLAVCEVTGDLSGNMLIAHPIDSGLKLVEFMMFQSPGTITAVNEDVVSAYKEFVNIIGGAYLSNIANFLGFKLMPQVPKFVGELGKVQKELFDELQQDVGKLLMINTKIDIESEQIGGSFFIIFNEESLHKIISTIRDQA